MAGEERCRHEMLPGQCSICRGIPEPDLLLDEESDDDRPATATGWIVARHPGRCTRCGEPFSAGAEIQPGSNGYVADCCRNNT